jgi:hypothetical protein
MPSIEEKLIECYSERKPVLLFNDSRKNVFNRVSLVRNVHKQCGGVLDQSIEYIETAGGDNYDEFIIKKSNIFIEFLNAQRNKALHVIEYKLKEELGPLLGFKVRRRGVIQIGSSASSDWIDPEELDVEEFNRRRDELPGTDPEAALRLYKKEMEINDSVPYFYDIDNCENQAILRNLESEVRRQFRSTEKHYRHVNCGSWKGKEVYSNLTQKHNWGVGIPMCGYLKGKITTVPFIESMLFNFRGTVFLNDLSCDHKSPEDDKYYYHLSRIIKKSMMAPEDNLLQEVNPIRPEHPYNVLCNWIVAYTDDIDAFSEDFLTPFKLVTLDKNDWGRKTIVPVEKKLEPEELEEQVVSTNEISEEKITLSDALLKGTEYKPDKNMFIKNADYWIISYDSKTIPLGVKGNVGLEYIARLLNSPGTQYESHILRNMVEKKTPIDSRETVRYGQNDDGSKEDVETSPKEGHRSIMDGVDVVLDKEAREAYNNELNELNRRLEKATKNNDFEQKDKIQEEINFINKQMIADLGLKDRPRRFTDANETARKAISNNVNRIYKKIEKEHKPLLKHLKGNITIGRKCYYSSEKDSDWNIQF